MESLSYNLSILHGNELFESKADFSYNKFLKTYDNTQMKKKKK